MSQENAQPQPYAAAEKGKNRAVIHGYGTVKATETEVTATVTEPTAPVRAGIGIRLSRRRG
ncbi:hypothetical protein [Streptomyces virginiae]